MEETPTGECSNAKITTAMRAATKAKAASYKEKFQNTQPWQIPSLGTNFWKKFNSQL